MIYVLSKNKKNITNFHLKIIIFRAVKYCSLLHMLVFVMAEYAMESNLVVINIDFVVLIAGCGDYTLQFLCFASFSSPEFNVEYFYL